MKTFNAIEISLQRKLCRSGKIVSSPVRIFNQCEGDRFSVPPYLRRKSKEHVDRIGTHVTRISTALIRSPNTLEYARIDFFNGFPCPKEGIITENVGHTHKLRHIASIPTIYSILTSNWICLQPMRMYDKSTDSSVRNDKKNLLCFELENSPHFSKTPDCHIRESNINVLSPLEFSCYDTFLKSVTLRGNAYVKLVSSNRIKASLSI